jgi:hypothetical protein
MYYRVDCMPALTPTCSDSCMGFDGLCNPALVQGLLLGDTSRAIDCLLPPLVRTICVKQGKENEAAERSKQAR